MRLAKQPRREVMWTVEWTCSDVYSSRQSWAIVLEEQFGRWGKQYEVYAESQPMGCRNSSHFFQHIGQARKCAAAKFTTYGAFFHQQEWQPGKTLISRWHDPFFLDQYGKTALVGKPRTSWRTTKSTEQPSPTIGLLLESRVDCSMPLLGS